MGGRGERYPPWLPLAALVVLAAALRFSTLTTQSLWFDEAATHAVVRLPFGEMLRQLPHRESNPPVFYAIEWVTTRAFGSGAFGLRLLSAVAGTLTVPVGWAIGRRLAGPRAALAVGALVAVNPLLVWFSQEARSYGLVVLWSALGLLFFLRALDDPRARWIGWWALASGLALATHYFSVFVLLPQGVWLLWRHPRRREVVAACAALVALSGALLPLLLAQRGNPYDISSGSLGARLAQVAKQFVLGYRGPLEVATGILAGVLVLGGAWLLVRETAGAPRRRALGVAAVGAIGIVIPLLAALGHADYFNTRNVIPALVPFVAALGVGYGASRQRLAGGLLCAGLCAVSLALVIAVDVDANYQRPNWKGLAKALGTTPYARAVVGSNETPIGVYRPRLTQMSYITGATIQEVDVVAVADGSSPGDDPKIPAFRGGPPGGFVFVGETRTPTYAIRRYRAPAPVHVLPDAVAASYFGTRLPSIDLLPGGR